MRVSRRFVSPQRSGSMWGLRVRPIEEIVMERRLRLLGLVGAVRPGAVLLGLKAGR